MSKETISLKHPVLGERSFDKAHAYAIMSYDDSTRGGWEFSEKQDAKDFNSLSGSDANFNNRDTGDSTDEVIETQPRAP